MGNGKLEFNLVELFADPARQGPSLCKFGNVAEGHACYCHHSDGKYRKCPIWRNYGEGDPSKWNTDNCPLFEKENKDGV